MEETFRIENDKTADWAITQIHEAENERDRLITLAEEQIKDLFENDKPDRHGIGVKNVNDRIKIYFGDKYGIEVQSELDEGTRVIIRIPKITEEIKHE